MTDKYILTDPTEADLVSAVQGNLFALFRSMQAIPGCELVEKENLSLHHAFPANPMFRGAWRTRFPAEETETRIDEVVDWFDQRQAPSFFWWTDSQTQPGDLAERLMERGFDGNMEGDPGMVMDLDDLNDNLHSSTRFNIIQAAEQKTLEDWRDVFAEAFEAQLSDGQAWVDATLSVKPENAPWQMSVGYLEDKPVSTSILYKGGGVAGVYGVGTIPEARNKGLGTAITLKTLVDAREQGYRFAVLFSSRMGYPVYRRLGFREVACRIGIYIKELP